MLTLEFLQARRHVVKSGLAEVRASAFRHEWGRAREGISPSRTGDSGDVPRENF